MREFTVSLKVCDSLDEENICGCRHERSLVRSLTAMKSVCCRRLLFVFREISFYFVLFHLCCYFWWMCIFWCKINCFSRSCCSSFCLMATEYPWSYGSDGQTYFKTLLSYLWNTPLFVLNTPLLVPRPRGGLWKCPPSVRPSFRPSVRPSFRPSVLPSVQILVTTITQERSHVGFSNLYQACIYERSRTSLDSGDLDLKVKVTGHFFWKSCYRDNSRTKSRRLLKFIPSVYL